MQKTMIVQSGQTGYGIARKNGMTFAALQKANPGIDFNNLKAGQSISLGGSTATSTKTSSQSPTGQVVVKKGDTASAIAKKSGLTLGVLQTLNPGVNLSKIKPKQVLNTSAKRAVEARKAKVSTPIKAATKTGQVTKASTSPSLFATSITNNSSIPTFSAKTTPKTSSTSGIMTLEKFQANLSPEEKALMPHIKREEGKVTNIYIAPEGMATIGHGHLLINKPQFLLNIEQQNLTPSAKNKKVKEALKNPANAALMKASLQKDLQDAIKTTGIKNVPSSVSSDLKLTDAQINLLLNSDIKKAHEAMEKQIGKENLKKRTTNQKLVALDMFYNVGSNLKAKAPSFVKHFKAGNIPKAQAELDIFKSDGKIYLGLMRRSYERMQLLNDNKGISDEAKAKLMKAYNQYCEENNKQIAKNFAQAEKVLKA